MARKENLKKVLSLSAASIALLQTATLTQSQITQSSLPPSTAPPSADESQKNAGLTLQPPLGRIALLYADHTSHASHSSHYSSTTDSGANYSTPAPTTPAYTPPPAPAPPPTATSVVTTNDVTVTNAMTGVYPSEKIEILTKAAAEGSPDAQLALGLDYANGARGVKQNTERAKMLFELSAIQGNVYAKSMLDSLNETNIQSNTNNVSKQ